MEEKKRYSILAVVLLAVLILAGVGYRVLSDRYAAQTENTPEDAPYTAQEESRETKQNEPMTAPDFTVTDREGNEVRLADQIGKPVIVNFWASWCPPCRSELPDFDAASQTYGEEITFMMVDLCDGMRETPVIGSSFVEENGYSFPVYFDTTGEAAGTYGVYSIPMTVGIDPTGEITAVYTGAMTEAQVQSLVNSLLP